MNVVYHRCDDTGPRWPLGSNGWPRRRSERGRDEVNEDPKPLEAESEGRKLTVPPGLVVAVLVAVALIFFVVQNNDEVAFKWLFLDMTGPLWVVIVVAAIAGAVLNEVLGFLRRRRRRRR